MHRSQGGESNTRGKTIVSSIIVVRRIGVACKKKQLKSTNGLCFPLPEGPSYTVDYNLKNLYFTKKKILSQLVRENSHTNQ
jgi:hypothetical protein